MAPRTAIATNHIAVTGPKKAPTLPVPWRWITKSPVSTPSVIGITKGLKTGVATSRPSTAESTEIAGVIMLSP